jgi:hypothetical protein
MPGLPVSSYSSQSTSTTRMVGSFEYTAIVVPPRHSMITSTSCPLIVTSSTEVMGIGVSNCFAANAPKWQSHCQLEHGAHSALASADRAQAIHTGSPHILNAHCVVAFSDIRLGPIVSRPSWARKSQSEKRRPAEQWAGLFAGFFRIVA